MKIHIFIAHLILAALLVLAMPLYAWSDNIHQAEAKVLTSP